MYPADWHRSYGDKTGDSARAILPPLLSLFAPSSLLEVGCGNAHWTQAGIDTGIGDYLVVDGPWNNRDDLLVDRARFLEADLAEPLSLGRRFGMAICLEVAEHVRGDRADVLVDSLTTHADVLLFGAAIPMQGGFGHINEQWPSWWRTKFAARGYHAFDLVRPNHWQDRSIHYWYRQNAFVYVSENNARATELARAQLGKFDTPLFDAVHPEKFEEVASYRAIAGKRLIKQLPGWLVRRAKSKLSGRN